MKIKKSDIKVLIAFLVFAAALGSYFFCANKLQPETDAIKAENATLQSEVAYLQDLMDHKDEYIKETDDMKVQIDDIKAQFPCEIREEDQIMYANDMEIKHAVVVESVDMAEEEVVAAAEVAAPVVEAPVDETGEPIEGEAAEAAPVEAAPAPSISLARNISTIAFKTTYKSVKDIILMITGDLQMKKSIESFDIAYDETTGNLQGTLAVAMYSMGGIGKEYTGPNVSGIRQGTVNPFNTTESVAALRSATTDLSAVGAMDQANSPDNAKADERDSESDDEKSEE